MGMKKVKIENKVKNQMTRNEKLFYELYDELYDEDRLILFTTYFNIYDKFIFKKDIINYVLMKYPENEIYAANNRSPVISERPRQLRNKGKLIRLPIWEFVVCTLVLKYKLCNTCIQALYCTP